MQQEQHQQGQLVVKLRSAVTHMTNKLELVAAKSWYYILYRAFPYLKTHTRFYIPLNDLLHYLGMQTRNYAYIKQFLKSLKQEEIEFNILGKDKDTEWISCNLLATTGLRDGYVIAEFPPFLQEKLLEYNEMFVRINLTILRDFKNKHAFAFYNVFADYLIDDLACTEKVLTLEQMRKLLDLRQNAYPQFKEFHKFVIKRAVDEINEVSNIHVHAIPKREHRKVVAVKFVITPQFPVDPITATSTVVDTEATQDEARISINALPQLMYDGNILFANAELKSLLARFEVVFHQPLKEKLVALSATVPAGDVEAYLLFIATYVFSQKAREEHAGIKEKPGGGLFCHLLLNDDLLPAYLQEYEAHQRTQATQEQEAQERLVRQLKDLYHSRTTERFKEYLEVHYDDFKEQIKAIFAANPLLAKKKLTSKAAIFASPAALGILSGRAEQLGFTPVDFDTWRKQYEDEIANQNTKKST